MSNPRLLTLSSYRSKRSEESNLVNFIDKLPRTLITYSDIMKEDKMFLRKKVKDGDQGLLQIFKKVNIQSYREDDDYKRLEAIIRKYLNEFKTSAKQEQINRYKNTLKSYRSSCQKPANKQNIVFDKKGLGIDTKKAQKAGTKSVKSPTSSLQKLHQLKHFKNSKPLYQTFKLDSLKAKYSIEKEKHKNFTTIELNPKSKLRSSKLLSSSSTKNLSKKQISFFDQNSALKTQISEGTLVKCQTDRYLPPQQTTQFQAQTKTKNPNSVSLAQFENLFTPPDLLMECKLILEKAKQAPTFQSIVPSGPISPRFNSVNSETNEYLLQKSKPYSINNPTGPGISFSKQSNDSNLLQTQVFKKQTEQKQQQRQKQKQKIQLKSRSAQFVFDCIFSDNHEISFQIFSQIINRSFSSPVELYRIFQKADVSRQGIINIFTFGKCLQETIGHEQNYIKDIFQLLDMDRKGYIIQSDISNFVHQIVDTSCQCEETVKQMFMKVLYQADFKNNGKIQYWGLYFIKSLQCFKDMVVYISQFEFEVQC